MILMVKFVNHWFHILFHPTRTNKVDPIPYGNGILFQMGIRLIQVGVK